MSSSPESSGKLPSSGCKQRPEDLQVAVCYALGDRITSSAGDSRYLMRTCKTRRYQNSLHRISPEQALSWEGERCLGFFTTQKTSLSK